MCYKDLIMLKKHSVGNFIFSIVIMTIFWLLLQVDIKIISFHSPCNGRINNFLLSSPTLSRSIKKVFRIPSFFFTLCGYGYYLYMIINVDSKLTFPQVFSSLIGYLFLTFYHLVRSDKMFNKHKRILSRKTQNTSWEQ